MSRDDAHHKSVGIEPAYKLFRPGDLNAFFGLMLDNFTQLVILAGILIGVFGFPRELVLFRMIPGSAIGVLVGIFSTPGWLYDWPDGPAEAT